jgi:hypothetical protein
MGSDVCEESSEFVCLFVAAKSGKQPQYYNLDVDYF